MRVIAGEAKGRKLKAAPGHGVRPMTDQIREALFSSLGDQVRAATFLDLYAGSGAIGIEALSRGAAEALFVERDPEVAKVIRENLEITGLSASARVVVDDVHNFVGRPPDAPFDLVMVDPPFATGLPSVVLAELRTYRFLTDESLVILRLSSKTTDRPGDDWSFDRERRYGDSTLLYLRQKPVT